MAQLTLDGIERGTDESTEPSAGADVRPRLDRRGLLRCAAGSATALLSAGLAGCTSAADSAEEAVGGGVEPIAIGPLSPTARADAAFRVRITAAKQERSLPIPPHPTNGDERRYPTKFANYSKALRHDAAGDVLLDSYYSLLAALESGRFQDFERVLLGGRRPLTNPESAYAFVLQGADSHQLAVTPAPTFASAEQQSEAAEDYWAALLRDVPFNEYESSSLAQAAAADLSRFSDFRGPKVDGKVTPSTLFRWEAPGTLIGPYVSQFLLLDVPYGVQPFTQRNRTRVPGDDRLTDFAQWLANQNGSENYVPAVYDPVRRYMRNGRDLAEYVHLCQLNQDSYNAALILTGAIPTDTTGLSPAILSPTNPYVRSRTQIGFATFGAADAYDRSTRAIVPALKAVFFEKWLVHRRLRPEEYGGRVHDTLTGTRDYPIGAELLASPVLPAVFAKYGSYLLPQAFPEGCPTHPAYPAAHATYIGASVTMLKAFFNEDYVFPNPVIASEDGLELLPYTGPPLTVGGELNKLAMDVAFGRNLAGVHWRSDSAIGLYLGEAVAIRIMADLKLLFTEPFPGFTFTAFDGRRVTI